MDNLNMIADILVSVSSIALVVIVGVYAKFKVQIDKKAQQGNQMAKAQKMVSDAVMPLVEKAEHDGGDGQTKLMTVVTAINDMLDLAHLPHPTADFTRGEIEKGVKLMKQTQALVNTLNNAETQDNAQKTDAIVKSEDTTTPVQKTVDNPQEATNVEANKEGQENA